MRSIISGIVLFLAAMGIIVTSFGCGGGGGSSGGSGGGGSLSLLPTSLTVGGNGVIPLLARVNGSSVDVTWSVTGGGTITPTGIGTATIALPASGSITVTATRVGASGSDSSTFTATPGLATVTGRVIDEDFLSGVSGVTVQMKNGTTIVSSGTTLPDGRFAIGVSPSATRFHLASTPFPTGYYKQFTFSAKRYTVLDATCSAPLPVLAADANFPLADTIKLPNTNGPPPPPPNGCPP